MFYRQNTEKEAVIKEKEFQFLLLHCKNIKEKPDNVERHEMQLQPDQFKFKKESFMRTSKWLRRKSISLKRGFRSHDHSHFHFDYSRLLMIFCIVYSGSSIAKVPLNGVIVLENLMLVNTEHFIHIFCVHVNSIHTGDVAQYCVNFKCKCVKGIFLILFVPLFKRKRLNFHNSFFAKIICALHLLMNCLR